MKSTMTIKPLLTAACALAFVFVTSNGRAMVMAFQLQHQRQLHHYRRTFISTNGPPMVMNPPSKSKRANTCITTGAIIRSAPSTTSLNAFPSTIAAVSAAGSAAVSAAATARRCIHLLSPVRGAVVLFLTLLSSLFVLLLPLLLKQKNRQRIFWSGLTYPSKSATNDLPPGGLGCPFIGSAFMFGNDKNYGAGGFYRKTSKALGEKANAKLGGGSSSSSTVVPPPKIWKYYFMGKSFAVVSGGKVFQKVLGMEFDKISSGGIELMEGGLMPLKSLLFERSKIRHSYLRRLVGKALTPAIVAQAAPTLQASAEEQVTRILTKTKVTTATGSTHSKTSTQTQQQHQKIRFQQICTDYTLDVAWRQILGLELSSQDEIQDFETNVATWIDGILSMRVLFKVAVPSSPGYIARGKVISKIDERIDQLLENGPDHKSTLSGMVFATDDDDDDDDNVHENVHYGNEKKKKNRTISPKKRLSREEIIDNALILIFAGSETSASILTNAMMFLGLHPKVWMKLVAEQKQLQQIHGEPLTSQVLDVSSAPFLDAILKETLRMRTLVGGIPRKTLTEIEVDGVTIPKGWLIDPSLLLTHEEDPSTKLPNAEHLDAIKGFHPERWLSDDNDDDSKNINDNDNDNRSEQYIKPSSEWYVPYGFGPRYCLGKNLAQLEMKIFLSTMARKISHPRLDMIPKELEDHYYNNSNNDSQNPNPINNDDERINTNTNNYFSVEWSSGQAIIPTAADGVLASVTAAAPPPSSVGSITNGSRILSNSNISDNTIIYSDNHHHHQKVVTNVVNGNDLKLNDGIPIDELEMEEQRTISTTLLRP